MPPQEHDEGGLIERAKRGDGAAFEEIVRRYDADVLRLALRLSRSEDAARDLYQETFLKAFRSIGAFRGECALRTWLYRIVANACRDQVRRRVADRRAGETAPPAGDRGDDWTVEAARLLVDRRPSHDPERAAHAGEVRRRVADAVRLLPERERLVFTLRHDEEMRLSDVAGILETSEETVRNCLYRAHQRLRAALADLREPAPDAAPSAGRRLGPAGRVESLNGAD